MAYLVVALFGFILLSSTILAVAPNVFGQIPTQQYIQRMEAEGKSNCEIMQINEFFYKPIRINLVHERVADHQVSIKSSDPASEVFWEGSFQTFQMVTESTDRFDVEVLLDYEVKHEEPRQVYYQIYALNNELMMEGNWNHEGFTFCKVFSFFANEQPYVPTFDDIQEQNNKFNSDFRKEVASSNTTIQNGMITVSIVVLIVGILVGLVFFLIIVSLKSMGRIGAKPVKKLDEMIGLVRTVAENLKLVSDHLIRTNANTKVEVVHEINKVLADLSIVVTGLKGDLEKSGHIEKSVEAPQPKKGVIEVVPTTPETVEQSLEGIENVVKETTKEKGNTPEEEAENELSQAEQYGVLPTPDVITFVPSDIMEDEIDKPSNPEEIVVEPKNEVSEDKISDKPKKEPVEETKVDIVNEKKSKEETDEEERIISIDSSEIQPCHTCGAKPDSVCGQCDNQYCDKHHDHDCKGIREEEKDPVFEIAKKGGKAIKDQFFEEKKPNILDKGEVERRLEAGEDEKDIEDELADEYFKTPRNDNLDEYGKLQKIERKNRSKANSLRVGAMLRTLNKQVIN